MSVTELQTKCRAWVLFQSALKTDATRSDYGYGLANYLKWTKLENLDLLVKRDPNIIQTELENYMLELKLTKGYSAIKITFYAIFLFYSMNDIILNVIKLRNMFPKNEAELRDDKAYTTEQVSIILDTIPKRRSRILKYKAARMKALIHFLAASGVRIGSLDWLKMKHIEKLEGCYQIKVYGNTQDQYITFLTEEATDALDEYLLLRKNMYGDLMPFDPVFDFDSEAIRIGVRRLIRKAIPSQAVTNSRYDIALFHGFRKRFNTVLKLNKEINPNIIEKLMGHKRGLDGAYLKPEVDELYMEYKKGQDQLTISPDYRDTENTSN